MTGQMAQSSHHIPQSVQVTFMIDGQPTEANLLVGATNGTCLQYIIGVDMKSEEVLPSHINSESVEYSFLGEPSWSSSCHVYSAKGVRRHILDFNDQCDRGGEGVCRCGCPSGSTKCG